MAKTLLKSASYLESSEYQTLIPRHGQYVPHRPVLPTIPIHQIPNITNAQQAVSTLAYHAKQLIHNSQTLATTQTKLGQLATLLTSIILRKTTQKPTITPSYDYPQKPSLYLHNCSIFAPTST